MVAINTSFNGYVLVVRFLDAKILDSERIDQIGNELREVVPKVHNKLLLDFTGVSFMSSAMINRLVMLNKTCIAHGVKLRFCGVEPNVADVFRITGLGGSGPDTLGSPVPNPTSPPADSTGASPPQEP